MTELELERQAEQERATRQALDERDKLLRNSPSIPRDDLGRRITKLRGGDDPEDEDDDTRADVFLSRGIKRRCAVPPVLLAT